MPQMPEQIKVVPRQPGRDGKWTVSVKVIADVFEHCFTNEKYEEYTPDYEEIEVVILSLNDLGYLTLEAKDGNA
jgi:hypothetical protein